MGTELDDLRERVAVLEEARRNGEGDIAKLEASIAELHTRISASREDLSRQIGDAVAEWREARLADEAAKTQSQRALLERRENDRKERGKTLVIALGIFVSGSLTLATFFAQLFGWFH